MKTAKSRTTKETEVPSKNPPTGPRQNGGGEIIAMDEAIKLLKTTRPTFYRWLRSGRFKGMKAGRQWRFYRRDIESFLKGQEPVIELPTTIGPLLQTLQVRLERAGLKRVIARGSNDVEKVADLIIRLGWQLRASDFHVAPHLTNETGEPVAVVRYRVDGVLHVVAEFDPRLLPAFMEQWKKMAGCNVRETAKPQDGRVLSSLDEPKKELDLRISFLPTRLGESLTVRILDRSVMSFRIDRLDYSPRDKERLLNALGSPSGVVLVSGPTGTGKTTVLYACLAHLAAPERKLMTVEDPIEAFLPWVVQSAVNQAAGATFATLMRAMLRSDPDVIMLGEIRDRDTLQIAIQAALTGHLILTTLHTEDAPSALQRMVEIGVDPFLVGDSTRLIASQRLVRLLCQHCSVEKTPSGQLLERAARLVRAGGLDWASLAKKFREPVGCLKCAQTGFRGRTVIAETLAVTPEIGAALRRGALPDELRTIAVGQGMTTMAADGIRRAAEGITTLAEVIRVLGLK